MLGDLCQHLVSYIRVSLLTRLVCLVVTAQTRSPIKFDYVICLGSFEMNMLCLSWVTQGRCGQIR